MRVPIKQTDGSIYWEEVMAGTALNQMAQACHQNSIDHGFWDDLNASVWSEKIALIHSEASEMLEALRDGDEAVLADECADVIIRVLDFTAARNIDIDEAVHAKMQRNIERPRMHGRKF